MNHLKKVTILSQLIDIVLHSITQTYAFLFIIIMEYLIFAHIGMALFGGCISSETPSLHKERVGGDLNKYYEYLNWNDFTNSLVFLFAINMNNQMIMLINMSTVSGGIRRDYRCVFFLVFVILNNMILFNIFIGQVIGISIEYFKAMKEKKAILSQVFDDSETDQEDSAIGSESVSGRSRIQSMDKKDKSSLPKIGIFEPFLNAEVASHN